MHTYDTGTDVTMWGGGEQTLLVGRNTENDFGNGAIDWEGNTVIPFVYLYVDFFSEGMAAVKDENGMGFVNRSGALVVPTQFQTTRAFSDGLAVVEKKDDTYAYIDKTGKIVIDASKYRYVDSFSEGMARVWKVEGNTRRYGFIDKTGKEVIPCQYDWVGHFIDGVTYVLQNQQLWTMDKTGKKLNYLTDAAHSVSYTGAGYVPEKDILKVEKIIDFPGGDHEHMETYYDRNGEFSYETYLLKAGLSEGLAPYRDEKTKKYGYVNESGAWVIAPAFDVAEKFEDGYAVVQNEITLADGTKDVEWGIIQNPNR